MLFSAPATDSDYILSSTDTHHDHYTSDNTRPSPQSRIPPYQHGTDTTSDFNNTNNGVTHVNENSDAEEGHDMLMDAFEDFSESDIDDDDWDDRRIEPDANSSPSGGGVGAGIRSFFRKPSKTYLSLGRNRTEASSSTSNVGEEAATNTSNASSSNIQASSSYSSSSQDRIPTIRIESHGEPVPLQNLSPDGHHTFSSEFDASSSSSRLLPSNQSASASTSNSQPESSSSSSSASNNVNDHNTNSSQTDGGFFSRGIFSGWRSRQSRPSLTAANQNDGVFNNMNAKPDTDSAQDGDFPPSYEEAAADAAPLYWETTIMSPGYADEIFIDGLPVGSPINFIWNMMVSAAFQFIGFLLTYLLHTSHAAKQGARAGLGFTLFQYGFYLQPSSSSASAGNPGGNSKQFEPSNPNDYNVGSNRDSLSGTFHHHLSSIASSISSSASSSTSTSTSTSSTSSSSSATTATKSTSGWISFVLMTLGFIILAKSVLDYIRARKMELVILQSPSAAVMPIETEDADNMV